jgi:cell division protein FtsQ
MRSLTPQRAYRAHRNDPAPSRWSYRLMRIMLSPVLRRLVFFGIPAAVCVGGAALYLADEARRDHIVAGYEHAYRSIVERPEFMVNVVAIHGASPALDMDIREVLPVDLPVSQFDLDLKEIHAVLRELDPVSDARLQIMQGGTLEITVVERQPAFLWRNRDTLEVLDETGAFVRFAVSRLDYPNLPLIVGDGADTQVAVAKKLLAAGRPIANRIRGFSYIGERRWDVVLDNDQTIMLPEKNPVQAFERVLVLDETQDLLSRNIVAIDMRLSQRPTLRVGQKNNQDLVNTNVNSSEAVHQ